ncbi:MAG: hypothetical protein JSV56_08015 [Methanomassiliicoccales archaeon]|nr:MAG: hypothetical protein JSV56_08015 [Methanomassiliicoccales archaeon]
MKRNSCNEGLICNNIKKGDEKMTGYITYMEVSHNSEGVTPKQLSETLRGIGWKPIYGRYDYAYEWGTDWGNKDRNMQEFFDHINNTHECLRNCKVNYSLRTYEHGTEDFTVKTCE